MQGGSLWRIIYYSICADSSNYNMFVDAQKIQNFKKFTKSMIFANMLKNMFCQFWPTFKDDSKCNSRNCMKLEASSVSLVSLSPYILSFFQLLTLKYAKKVHHEELQPMP